MTQSKCGHKIRLGVSLLEVIACTALVAVMIVPIAGVIRASGQSITQSQGDASTEANLRRGLQWLSDYVRDTEVISVQPTRLNLQPASGSAVFAEVQNGDLVISDGIDVTVITEDVRNIRFTQVNQTVPPNDLVGVAMTLRARDPISGGVSTVNATVSIPTQF